MTVLRPTWAEVDLDSIAHNMREIRRVTSPSAEVMAVVKADAYGHGAVEVAQTALANGASRLAVSILDEALELRRAGFMVPILILGYTPDYQAETVVQHNITQAIYRLDTAQALSLAATNLGKKAKVHIKLDTGMGRLGVAPDHGGPDLITAMRRLPNLELEGLFTHFAAADDADPGYTQRQFETYQGFVQRLEDRGIRVPIRHVANSAAILNFPEMHLDMVRVGISLYGYYPSPQVRHEVSLRPALSLKTQIGHLKTVPAGTGISYGVTHVTDKATTIATLPIGYADGLSRRLSNVGQVLVRGRFAPILGRVCMDQCMIDVGHIPDLSVGDDVIVFGQSQDQRWSAEDIANQLGTISYEVLCAVARRVPRVYLRGGETIRIKNLLLR